MKSSLSIDCCGVEHKGYCVRTLKKKFSDGGRFHRLLCATGVTLIGLRGGSSQREKEKE